MPSNEPYHLLHTASMVGLFTCVFVRDSYRSRIRDLSAGEIKRGMGGLHGNKVHQFRAMRAWLRMLIHDIGCPSPSIRT